MDSYAIKKAVPLLVLPTASAAYQGVLVRLTTDNKPYWCTGSAWVDLSLTGSGGGSSTTGTTVSVNFGTKPVSSKSFQVTVAGAAPGDKFIISAAPDSDEYEMDNIVCSGYCAVADTLTVFAQAVPGPVKGSRNITYIKV